MKNVLAKLAAEYKAHLSIAVLVIAGLAFYFGFWFNQHGPPPKCGSTNQELAACTAKLLRTLGATEVASIQCLPIDTPGEYRCVVTPTTAADNTCYSLVVKRGPRGYPIPIRFEAPGVC